MNIYPFPRRFLYAEVILFSLISTLMIFAWMPAFMSLVTYGSILGSALRAAIFLNITAVTLILFVAFIKRELRRLRFVLSDEQLIFQTSSREKKLRLSTIASVSLVRFPLGGGIMVIESGDGQLSIPLIIKNSADLVTRLREYCATRNQEVATGTHWDRIGIACSLSAIASDRDRKVFGIVLPACIFMLPLNVLVGAIYWNMSIVPLMIWSVAGPFFPFAAFACADLLLRITTARHFRAPQHTNLPDEDRVLARSGVLFFILFMVSAIAFKALVL
jgi:hypothetical protein